MADRLRDGEDEKLEALFRAEPIADDGFSERVMSRIRRDLFIRRWTLPAAMLIGGLIAAKPAGQMLLAMAEVLAALPVGIELLPLDSLPQAAVFILGGAAVGVLALFINGLEE